MRQPGPTIAVAVMMQGSSFVSLSAARLRGSWGYRFFAATGCGAKACHRFSRTGAACVGIMGWVTRPGAQRSLGRMGSRHTHTAHWESHPKRRCMRTVRSCDDVGGLGSRLRSRNATTSPLRPTRAYIWLVAGGCLWGSGAIAGRRHRCADASLSVLR